MDDKQIVYDIKAIPTTLNGRLYRSRLEAKWAAFFVALKWHTDYEPCDFNGWFPDFAIYGHDTVFAEVKPVSAFPKNVADKIDRACPPPDYSRCSCPCDLQETATIILGLAPFQEPDDMNVYLGWLRQFGGWETAPLGLWNGKDPSRNYQNTDKKFGFCHSVQSYHDRITGCYDGGCYGADPWHKGQIMALWNQAANAVQWNKS